MYVYLLVIYFVYSISCCPHADQILTEVHAPHDRLNRLGLMHCLLTCNDRNVPWTEIGM